MDLRYPGQLVDSETGFYYNQQRYYDPSLGRYITSDPIGLAGGLNLYGYAEQNPLIYTDPEGLAVCGGFCVAALVWGVAEAGLSLWDAYDTAKTLTDDCTTTGEKFTAASLFAAGVLLPGSYGWLDNATNGAK